MKAIQINSYGDENVLELKDIPQPVIGEKQVLVEVHAASLNPFDRKLMAGYMKNVIPLHFPLTLGGDFAGKVIQLSGKTDGFDLGDEVFGQANAISGSSGAFAEYAAVNTGSLSPKPSNINMIGAASIPLVGVSAIQALEDIIKLHEGQKILIHGGAGGIGSAAIQLAKSLGAYVATTVSGKDIDFADKLGADVVMDYQNKNFDSIISNYDAVFDTVGGETANKSFRVLKKGGILVSMVGMPDQMLAKQYGVETVSQNTKTDSRNLLRLKNLIETGKIKPQVDKVFPLNKTGEAFRHLEEEHPQGKVVLAVK